MQLTIEYKNGKTEHWKTIGKPYIKLDYLVFHYNNIFYRPESKAVELQKIKAWNIGE